MGFQDTVLYYFTRFMLHTLTFEYVIGKSTMNPERLNRLSEDIRREEGRLLRLELNR